MTDAKSRYGAADIRYVTAFQVEASPARLHFSLALADAHWEPADRDRLAIRFGGRGVRPLLGIMSFARTAKRLTDPANPLWTLF